LVGDLDNPVLDSGLIIEIFVSAVNPKTYYCSRIENYYDSKLLDKTQALGSGPEGDTLGLEEYYYINKSLF